MSENRKKKSTVRPGSGDSNNRILQVASALFANKGFDAVTVREISRMADIGMPTIYYFYGDKEILYRMTVLAQQADVEQNLEQTLSRVESLEDLHAWFRILVDSTSEQNEFTKMIFREFLSDRDDLHQEMGSGLYQRLYDAIRDKLNQIRPGSGDGIFPIFLISSVFGYVSQDPLKKHLHNYAPALDQGDLAASERKELADLLFDLFQTQGKN